MKKIYCLLKSFIGAIGYCLLPGGVAQEVVERISPWMILVWGLVYGLILCGVFAASWKFFGDIYFTEYARLRIVPMAMVILVGSIMGFKQLLGLGVTVDRLMFGSVENGQEKIPQLKAPGQLAILLAVLLKYSILLAIPYHAPWWPGDWRRHFNFLYPKMHYRLLMLLGLWGKTGLLIAGGTGPVSMEIDQEDRIIRRKLTIKSLIGNLILCFLITSVYFSQWRNRSIGVLVSFVIFLAIYLCSMIISWKGKGHDRFKMFACAELSEIFLLLSYMAIARFL